MPSTQWSQVAISIILKITFPCSKQLCLLEFIIKSEKCKTTYPPGACSHVKHFVQLAQIRNEAFEFQKVYDLNVLYSEKGTYSC